MAKQISLLDRLIYLVNYAKLGKSPRSPTDLLLPIASQAEIE
ncbi:hypothetical protein [Gilliamella mensalis]|nr:hypothetical protein [Gilliamella mensalis]